MVETTSKYGTLPQPVLDDPIAVTNSRYYDKFCFISRRRRRLIVRYEMRKAQKGSFECCWRYRYRSFLIVPQIQYERKIPPKKTLGQTRCTPEGKIENHEYIWGGVKASAEAFEDALILRTFLEKCGKRFKLLNP